MTYGWLPHEVSTIRDALNRMPYFCEDCGSHKGKLTLAPDTHGIRFRTHHLATCPVLRNARSRRACDMMMRDFLYALGHWIPDYNDDTVGEHAACP